jgi:GDP-4-dehydro-6-deoxy-D-mannose reductase
VIALVTGAAGFVGRHLVRALEARGHAVVCAVRPGEVFPGALEAELTDRGSVERLLDVAHPELVFHLAAQSHVGRSLGNALEPTILGAATMATLLAHGLAERGERGGGARLVFVSSGESYGRTAERGPCEEDWPPEPLSPYGAGKRVAEEIVLQAVRARGLDAVIARPFNHLGRGQSAEFLVPSLARQIANAARGGASDVAVGDLSTVRDYTDVRDVASGYLLLAETGARGGIYNLCSGRGRSGEEIFERIARLSGANVKPRIDPSRLRKVDLPRLIGSPSKAESLGWRRQFEIDETLREVLADVP